MSQVAASHWQLHVCQLLLAKGADIEARDWYYSQTPLSLACRIRYGTPVPPDLSSKDLTDIVRLLVEHGLDILTAVEIDTDLFVLAGRLFHTYETQSTKRKLASAFSWLIRSYMCTITCDGVFPSVELHPQVCEAILQSKICDTDLDGFWIQERPGCTVLTPKDSQAFQSLWLQAIEQVIHYEEIYEFSPQFCQLYTGDFHYRQLWDVGGDSTNVSPMELALRSFDALRTFHGILLACGTEIIKFAEVECTMPWCTYTHNMLMEFFSLRPQEYIRFYPLLSSEALCHDCGFRLGNEGITVWKEVVDMVRSGGSLRSSLGYMSEERRDLSSPFCQSCILGRKTFDESGGSRTDWEEDTDEEMGFVDGEIDEDSHSDVRISVMEDDQTEGGTNSHLNSERSSECSSDEASDGESD